MGLDPDRTLSLSEAAGRIGVSGNHLEKIAQDLVRAGVVESVRGRSGGVRRTAGSLDTTVGDVVRSVASLTLVECFDPTNDTCRLSPPCRLNKVLDAALDAFLATLDEVTVAELCARPTKLRRLLA